jgi:hypothetical protein
VPAATLLLSIDFEDWHQLVRRRVGDPRWERPGPALARQTEAALALLDELRLRCTFFVLGMAARAHPELVGQVAAAGHEIACHGDRHEPVHAQGPEQFAHDLRAARATIAELTGCQPAGYRAPAFSITRSAAPWAHAVLAAEGFAYDASEHERFALGAGPPREDSGARPPREDGGAQPPCEDGGAGPPREEGGPRQLLPSGLWELPVAVCRVRGVALPVGGASYWALAPTRLVLAGLGRAGEHAGLYLHPQELDPEPLRALPSAGLPAGARLHARLRAAQRNSARRRAPTVLRAIAERFQLITYGEAYEQLSQRASARA